MSLSALSQVYGGQDADPVVMRATTLEGATVAVKVSRNPRTSGVLAATVLAEQIPLGIPAPLRARSGEPYSTVDARTLSLTPWIAGRPAFETGMGARQWRSFGELLSRVHAAQLPAAVVTRLPAEDYRTPPQQWRAPSTNASGSGVRAPTHLPAPVPADPRSEPRLARSGRFPRGDSCADRRPRRRTAGRSGAERCLPRRCPRRERHARRPRPRLVARLGRRRACAGSGT